MNDATTLTEKIIQPMEHRAMLARLSIGIWTAVKTDKKLAEAAAISTGGDKSMHSHRRRIIAKDALQKIEDIAAQARRFHEKNTLPWEYDGVGALYSPNYFSYLQEMRKFEAAFHQEVEIFRPNYATLITAARPLLGDAWNQKDYPHPSEIARRFFFRLTFSKIEMGSDFRVPDIGREAEAQIQAEIDKRTHDAVDGMVKAVWAQVAEHVGHMVNRLKAYQEREEKRGGKGHEGTFRDTIIENIKDFVERIPILNMTESPEIEDMRLRLLQQLCSVSGEDLRLMPLTRNDVLAKAEKILADVSEFLA